MRAFAWLSAASLALAGCAGASAAPADAPALAPRRVVSLNLCTDELLLLLAEPGQIASVTHLSQQAAESPLAAHASAHPANDGSLLDAAVHAPDLVLTQGGSGDRRGIAGRLGIRVVDLPFPQSIDDEIAAIRQVALALGRREAGEVLVARIEAVRSSAPVRGLDAVYVAGGGRTVPQGSLEAEWMRLAGLSQRAVPGERIELEPLLADPPAVLLRSDYRAGQYSAQQAWLAHPLASGLGRSRAVTTDGRAWTCGGALLADEVLRLRREIGS